MTKRTSSELSNVDETPHWLTEAAVHLGLEVSRSTLLMREGYQLSERIVECIDAPLIHQRSAAWFELRKTRITGSIVDTILRSNPFQDYTELVCTKAGMPTEFNGNAATEHGTLYEPEAISVYQRMTGRHVVELGLTPHKSTSLLAHSPDGISLSKTDAAVLLEVKCPLKRVIKPGHVPAYYMGQLQLGMEVFDVNEAHFVQYKPASLDGNEQFDITIVPRHIGWLDRNMHAFEQFWEEVAHWQQVGWRQHPKYALENDLKYLRHVCVL